MKPKQEPVDLHDLLASSLPAMPTIPQTAEALNVSYATVRRRISDGTIKAYRVGPREIRLDRASVLAWARSTTVATGDDYALPRNLRRPADLVAYAKKILERYGDDEAARLAKIEANKQARLAKARAEKDERLAQARAEREERLAQIEAEVESEGLGTDHHPIDSAVESAG